MKLTLQKKLNASVSVKENFYTVFGSSGIIVRT